MPVLIYILQCAHHICALEAVAVCKSSSRTSEPAIARSPPAINGRPRGPTGASELCAGSTQLASFRTGSHHLASVTGRWVVPRDSPSSHTHRLCTLCRLNRIEDEDHFIFECPTYRLLRTSQYPDLFSASTSQNLRKFLGQDQHRVASFIRDCFRTRDHVRTLAHEPPMAPTGR